MSKQEKMMMKKKLFGFTTLVILLVIGAICYILNTHQIDPKEIDLSKLSKELISKGYNIGVISFSPQNKEVTVQLSNKEPNLLNAKKDIKNYIGNNLKDSNLIGVSVSVKIKDFEQAKIERKWMSVISEIDKKLKEQSNGYTGIAIDFNPKPITYILKSSFSKSNIDEVELNNWLKLTNKVIVSKDLPILLINDETYEIKVIDKNNEVLKSNIYGPF